MTLDELNQIKNQLTDFRDRIPMSPGLNKELTESIWVIKREIELKTKCTETKYHEIPRFNY